MSKRAELLHEAEALVCGDRNNQYGPPTQDFDRTAAILNAMGYRRSLAHGVRSLDVTRPLDAHDVALILMAVKMSRLAWAPKKRDSWVDLAGYAACGYECTQEVETTDGTHQEQGGGEAGAGADTEGRPHPEGCGFCHTGPRF